MKRKCQKKKGPDGSNGSGACPASWHAPSRSNGSPKAGWIGSEEKIAAAGSSLGSFQGAFPARKAPARWDRPSAGRSRYTHGKCRAKDGGAGTCIPEANASPHPAWGVPPLRNLCPAHARRPGMRSDRMQKEGEDAGMDDGEAARHSRKGFHGGWARGKAGAGRTRRSCCPQKRYPHPALPCGVARRNARSSRDRHENISRKISKVLLKKYLIRRKLLNV